MAETPGSHEDLRMSGRAEVWIAAAPEVVYAAVSDLPRMGEWSPENLGGEWIDSSEAAVGATFRGLNRNTQNEWDTIATVTEAEPARRFAFCIARPGEAGTIWRFTFEPEGRGTVVTEAFEWQWTPVPDEGFRGRVGRMPIGAAALFVAGRQLQLQESIDATLAVLKRALDATGG